MKENKNTNHKVADGMMVVYTYTLTDTKGNTLFEADKDNPDMMIYGLSQDVVPGLLVAIKGLVAGECFEVTLKEDAAFGPRNEEWVRTLPREVFIGSDGQWPTEVKVGAMLPMMTEGGVAIHGIVKEITATDVLMDFNHPYAGMEVTYRGMIEDVHPATPEEIKALQRCGCGCGHDHCGCGDDCDCHHDDCGCGGHSDADNCSCGDDCHCGK